METRTVLLSTGIIVLIALLSPLGKTGCRAGWEEHNETHYKCITQAGERYQVCFDVYDSANTPNYWCSKGVVSYNETVYNETPAITPPPVIESKPIIVSKEYGKRIVCGVNEGCRENVKQELPKDLNIPISNE